MVANVQKGFTGFGMFLFLVHYPPSHPGTLQKYPPTTVDSKVVHSIVYI